MSAPVSASPHGRIIQVPRSLRSRVLGSTLPFPLPFGVLFTFVVVNGLFEGTSDVPPEDRLSPAGLVLTVAGLTLFALGGLVLGIAEWRRAVTLKDDGVEVHSGWRRRFIPWADVKAIGFCQIPMLRGTTPAAELVRRDGSRVELRALAQTGRRIRQRQVDVLAEACARHGVELRSDGSWFWPDRSRRATRRPPRGTRVADKPATGLRPTAVGGAYCPESAPHQSG